jgi:hypothetical protein
VARQMLLNIATVSSVYFMIFLNKISFLLKHLYDDFQQCVQPSLLSPAESSDDDEDIVEVPVPLKPVPLLVDLEEDEDAQNMSENCQESTKGM